MVVVVCDYFVQLYVALHICTYMIDPSTKKIALIHIFLYLGRIFFSKRRILVVRPYQLYRSSSLLVFLCVDVSTSGPKRKSNFELQPTAHMYRLQNSKALAILKDHWILDGEF